MRLLSLYLFSSAALIAPGLPAGAGPECTAPRPSVKELASNWCDGVHPGMVVVAKHARLGLRHCATGFMYADQKGNRYLSMEGTCVLDVECKERSILPVDREGILPPLPEPLGPVEETVDEVLDLCILAGEAKEEPVYAKNGPPVTDQLGHRIGWLAYAVYADGVNFALIRLDPTVPSSPAVPHWGGPTRLQMVAPAEPQKVLIYTPMHRTAGTPGYNARIGFAPQGLNGTVVAPPTDLLASYTSIVLSEEGAAVGTVNLWGGLFGTPARPYNAMARVAQKAKLQLKLVTAPLAP